MRTLRSSDRYIASKTPRFFASERVEHLLYSLILNYYVKLKEHSFVAMCGDVSGSLEMPDGADTSVETAETLRCAV